MKNIFTKLIKELPSVMLLLTLAVSLLNYSTKEVLAQENANIPTGAFFGEYYDNKDLTNLIFTRTDEVINFNWGNGSPDPAIEKNRFSVRWTGNFSFEKGTYQFTVKSDDGIRVAINGNTIIDRWRPHTALPYQATTDISSGTHQVTVEYFESSGGAVVSVVWEKVKSAEPLTNGVVLATTEQSRCVSLSANPSAGFTPLTVEFTGEGFASDGAIQEYEFDYADASGGQPRIWRQSTAKAYHRYENPGIYTAQLRVKDSKGDWLSSEECKKTIKVNAASDNSDKESDNDLSVGGTSELPKTGPSLWTEAILLSMGSFGLYLYKRFKLTQPTSY